MKFFLAFFILFTLHLYAKDEIRFGVYAFRGYEDTKKKYEPLVAYLNETLHKKVILEVLSQDEMNKKIAAKELDIVTTSPIHFLVIRQQHQLSGAVATLVAMYENAHSDKFAGVMVVRGDSSIKALQDIKGKIVATPNVNLLGGFRSQAYELHKSGVDIVNEAKEIKELKSGYKNVIKSVLAKESDVGFTRDGIVELMLREGELNEGDIRIINEKTHKNHPFKTSTALYPEWPVFALPHTDDEDLKKFVTALFLLNPDSEYAKKSQIYGYTLAADYLETEDLTRELRLPPFDKTPQITLEDIWDKYNYSLIIFMLALIGALISYIQIERKKIFVESLISNMGEGVYGVDVDGNCTWINQKALDMLGFGKEEVLYKNQHTMFHHHKPSNELYSADECPINQTLQDKISREAEDFFIKKDGSFFPIELSVASIDNDGAIVIFRDVTQKKAYENAILEEKKKAEEANSAKSQFLANMSHEIRTPMNAIIGLNQMMFDTDLSDKQRNLISKVNSSSKMLLGIINDILDYSKIEAKKLELEYKAFEIESILSQLRVLFGATAINKDVELYFHIKNNVPYMVLGDELRLSQVLTNLLSNALKFTHHGSILLNIDLKEKLDEQHAVLTFTLSDTGIGMSEQHLQKLFTPFTQADNSTTRKYGGTGLGLTISKRIIEAMGGTLIAQSLKGIGTTFSFELKVEVEAWDDSIAISKDELNKVLIVDDQEISREILKDILQKFGCMCDEAKDGEEAILMVKEADIRKSAYKIILMDWQMPQLNGKETIKRIHEMIKSGEIKSKAPTILMVSAHAIDEINLAEVEIDSFLSKPVTSSTLFDALSNAKNSFFKNIREAETRELPNFSGIKILLVEDNLINQEVASMMLHRVGIEVEVANNGKEALDKHLLNLSQYDLIFMDLHMPVMNGYEAAKHIRKHDKNIPIIALSAAALLEDVQKAKESGMNAHIGKPIETDELYKTIAEYCHVAFERAYIKASKDNSEVLDIEYLNNNFSSKESIDKLLRKFSHELNNEFKDIAAMLLTKDGNAPVLLHALKGVSGNLRANELYTVCQNIEAKYRAKLPIDEKDIEALTSAIAEVKEKLKELHVENKKDSAKIQKLSKNELRELYFEIRDGLLNGNIIKTHKYETLQHNLTDIIDADELDLFESAMSDLEYERAFEILNSWKL